MAKTTKKPNADKKSQEKKYRKPRATTLYPKYSLLDSLQIAVTIRDNNAGQPYNRIDLAASLGKTPSSSEFRNLITASGKFGITEGSYKAERISLTSIGQSIVSPMSDEEKSTGLLQALYTIGFYKDFFEKFKNNRLPRKDLLINTLEREFDIPNSDCEQCYDLLFKNASELGLLKDVSGAPYVRFDSPKVTEIEVEDNTKTTEDNVPSDQESLIPEIPDPGFSTVPPPEKPAISYKPKIFISHSKNMKILDQIKSNLDFGGFSYNVAIETETTAIPIPEKIFGMMRECNCGIVNVSADEQERREDGSFGINANVLVEIGAAFLAYNQRVILLVDKRLTLPSNLQGLYRCEYTGDELDSGAVTKLQQGLLQFRVPVD